MIEHFAQSAEQLAQEIEFWRDYIHWCEHKNGKPAGERARAALAAAESRERALDRELASARGPAVAPKKDP